MTADDATTQANDDYDATIQVEANPPHHQSKTLSDLPEEILQYILEFAVGNPKCAGFLNPSLVCYQWNDLISKSKWIMDDLDPKIVLSHSDNVEQVGNFQITRNYREITLHTKKTVKIKQPGILSTHPLLALSTISSTLANDLTELTLSRQSLTPYHIGLLIPLKNLDTLSIINCVVEPSRMKPLKLQQIDHLEIENTPNVLLSWLECDKLISFTLDNKSVNSYVVDFLNQVESLNEVKIHSSKEWNVAVALLKPKFMWNKLEFVFPSSIVSENALLSVKALCLASSENAEIHIHASAKWLDESRDPHLISVLNECKKINYLRFFYREKNAEIANIDSKIDMLRQMDEVERLDIGIDSGFEKLIKKFPNVTDLILESECNASKLSSMATELQNLEYLDITSAVIGDLSVQVPFKSLQTIVYKPPVKLNDAGEPESYNSSEAVWKFCNFNPSLKDVHLVQHDGPWWQIRRYHGKETVHSLINYYQEWLPYRCPVECSLFIDRSANDESKGLRKSREEKELEVFGRALNEDEKKFFSNIVIDGCDD